MRIQWSMAMGQQGRLRPIRSRLRPWACAAVGAALLLLLGGCEGIQAVMETHGPNADRIATIGRILFIGATVIFVLVMTLTALAVFARPERRRWLGRRRTIVIGGLIFPVVVLSILLVYTLDLGVRITGSSEGEPLQIHVIGNMWWWEVRYLEEDGDIAFVTANEIHIPVGQPVMFIVTTRDVIHSFWVPNLAGKIDMIPGHVNEISVEAERPGVFRGQCAEFCGPQHAKMAFYVVAKEPEDFARWYENQSRPAAEPRIPFIARGRDLFLSSGCGACHRVRGIPADGQIGPDLTHVGSRLTIGAGILDNHIGTIEAWIADSQDIKPDNRMPSFDSFAGEDLRALAAYLESLE